VVCAQPGSDPDERVIISITSDGEHIKDRSCEVAEGDHDFIKHRSYVLFRKAAIVTVGDLSAWKARGNLVIKTDMSAAVVDRIRHAALRSIYVSNDVKDCIDDCSWRPPAKS
jgi:hypothetical protein